MARVLLYTGKGGVGKTTSAAGTGTLAALRGKRTLVMSTDAAYSLADAFDSPVGTEPTEVDDRLFVQQVDPQRRFERSWGAIQSYLRSVLDASGTDPIEREELTVLPGAEEVLALLEVRDHVRSGEWDVIAVDCAPTAETLRLLALPDALGWYLDRFFNVQSKVVRPFRPTFARVTGIPLPAAGVVDAVRRLHADLAEVRSVLTGPDASVRLVLTPEAVVLAEARRSLTTLSLFGYTVDGVVANRVFPAAGADPWRRQWVAAQRTVLDDVATSFAPLPIWQSPYRACEPVGLEELAAFAVETYRDQDPFAPPGSDASVSLDHDGTTYTLSMSLPHATISELSLARYGDELIITIGCYRRVMPLPVALARSAVIGARLDDGLLRIRFAPGPSGSPLPAGAPNGHARTTTGPRSTERSR
jgi:arsenite-transporting ATPase